MVKTLKEAIKEFPTNAECIIESNIPANFSELSHTNKFNFIGYYDKVAIVNVKDDKLFFGVKTKTVTRYGKNIFINTLWSEVITIENNKVKSNASSQLHYFYKFINRPIADDLKSKWNILCKPYMIKAILCNKVYSEETFYKEWMNRAYHLKGFDWKLFRRFMNANSRFSILDLMYFTKNLHDSLQVLLNVGDNIHYTSSPATRLYDLLMSAIKLNEVVDFTWSDKRITEEHKRQINALMAKEIENKEVTPIFANVDKINTKDIKIINTEKDVFIEGRNMHHCLYTNYFKRIKNREYIAFHMTSPEDCTFSCKLYNGKLILDQIYLSYDRTVQSSTKKVAIDYINKFEEEIKNLLKPAQSKVIPEAIRLEMDYPF